MLILDRQDVEALLDLDALVDALGVAMSDLSAGRVSLPARVFVAQGNDGAAGLLDMPSFVPSMPALMSKLITVFAGNAGTGLPVRQAVIVAFDPETGLPAALMDGTDITAAKTAACSALSVRLLARQDACSLAILGTGAQARAHALAVARVRPFREIRVAGRDHAKATTLAAELSHQLSRDVVAVGSYEQALAGVDVACATTYATEPVVRRAWISPGMHITSVGYNPQGREIDDQTIADALLLVESRQAALAAVPPNRDLAEPIERGVITAEHIHAELGDLAAGTKPGRTNAEQITLYKSVGVAIQDAVAAALVLAGAREQSLGREIKL